MSLQHLVTPESEEVLEGCWDTSQGHRSHLGGVSTGHILVCPKYVSAIMCYKPWGKKIRVCEPILKTDKEQIIIKYIGMGEVS